MASDMMEALMALCQEKHIDQLYLIDRLEQSLAKSYAELLKLDWGAKVTIDRATGKIYVYKLEPDDDSMDEEGNYTKFNEVDVTPKDTSRIAAQHAKAEINAIVRNAAREQIYEEFSGRIGDIINGTVLHSTPDFTLVKIREGVEAELPTSISAATRTSATSARPASAICTTSASRPSSSTCATPTRRCRPCAASCPARRSSSPAPTRRSSSA